MSSSSSFDNAVAFISTSTTSSSPATKLRLYALYKIATTSSQPTAPRPALWSMEARAKWDAWTELGASGKFEGEEGREGARGEYVEEATKLGFGGEGEEGVKGLGGERGKKEGKGMVSVSQMAAEEPEEGVSTHLHDLAIDGKGEEVRDVLSTPAGRASIDARDGYGFTALHLAADRGHVDVVRALVAAGADQTLTEEEGQTALELATEAGHEDIVLLLQTPGIV